MDKLLEFKTTLQLAGLNAGNKSASETKRPQAIPCCRKHPQKPLDHHCTKCKEIVCVSCHVVSHASHKCKEVTAVDEEFRQTIKRNSSKVSTYADEMISRRRNAEIRKSDFLKEMVDKENAIHKRNKELKDMIDEHTKSLLNELSVIKSKHLKEMETRLQEIYRCCTELRTFEDSCIELVSKGSASDICSSVDQLMCRADELENDYEAFIGRPHQSVEVSFQISDLIEALQKSGNLLGKINESTSQFLNFVLVAEIDDGGTRNVVKVNLHRPNDITLHGQVPPATAFEAVAAVYYNTMYLSGLGDDRDEIWKYNMDSGWMKCASLVQGRHRHSAAFLNEVLYICGGYVDSNKSVLDSVESYNAVTDECHTVGKLVHCVQYSDNCVPFRSSLYIFGGQNIYYKDLSHVQVYNTKQNTCTLLTKPMPRPSSWTRAALYETFAVLVGHNTCFIFDFEAETWQDREQFKAGVKHFGLVLANEKVFVIGGGKRYSTRYGDTIYESNDDVRYVPLRNILQDKAIEWKIHGKLPRPSLVQAYGEIRITI